MNSQPLNFQDADLARKTSAVWQLLATIPDPEIPVLNLVDLGVIRWVKFEPTNALNIGVTPTYSGCPATDVIHESILHCLNEHGYQGATVTQTISPPWSSADITQRGRADLKAYGIAPPQMCNKPGEEGTPVCPLCDSQQVELLSAFGSTPCKSLFRCKSCLEPFDYFKCV